MAGGVVLYANAGSQGNVLLNRASMWALVGGCALCVSGFYASWAGRGATEAAAEAAAAAADDFLLPLLGALLVYRYQAMSEEQLWRALEQQRREGRNGRRLGDILLEMRLVSATQLRKALEYQQMEADRKRAGRAEAAAWSEE